MISLGRNPKHPPIKAAHFRDALAAIRALGIDVKEDKQRTNKKKVMNADLVKQAKEILASLPDDTLDTTDDV